MRLRKEWNHAVRYWAVIGVVSTVTGLLVVNSATAEERKFAVMLAHSPKSGVSLGNLTAVETINKQYFDRIDPNIDSFSEYWEEISYGDVTVTGQTFGWVTLPWPFEPASGQSPAAFIDLDGSIRTNEHRSCPESNDPAFPIPYGYGVGEPFCDCECEPECGGIDTVIRADMCGALIITDLVGDEPGISPPVRGDGMNDYDASGVNVWTPGERFLDVDGDQRWDGIDEKNDMMCHGENGCRTDPFGTGPRGCSTPGCGDQPLPCIDWDGDGGCNNCGDDCDVYDYQTCTTSSQCESESNTLPGLCMPAGIFPGSPEVRVCRPSTCLMPNPENGCNFQLPECCTEGDAEEQSSCVDSGGVPSGAAEEGINCGDAVLCCEFVDSNDNGRADAPEPFEDYMIRWNPRGVNAGSVWVPVDEDYIRNNYPGDVEALVRRCNPDPSSGRCRGNGIYDSPDLFIDLGNTKMMQDAGINRFAWRTPKPGARYSGAPNFEDAWFDSFWSRRYGSDAPDWPGGDGAFPTFNSPIMRPFDADEPVPLVVRGTPGRRWFRPSRGGWNGRGRGTPDDPDLDLDRGTDSTDAAVLPDEVFGYYDGWVEHDDLPSSKYHNEGDKRLGEITNPTSNTVVVPGTTGESYMAIFGVDLGKNNPTGGADNAFPDNFLVAAGPGAINIHGEKGFDAGDVCIVEWLTWRTDGTSRTIATEWEEENGAYHPYAGPASPRSAGPMGFADYNLDGMIDQGEVRPEGPGNYSVDANPFTNPNLGTNTDYPFNRRRLVEDVVEALDSSVDWDDFVDANRGNTVSGIVLVPVGAYTDLNRFPFNPSYTPIFTRDTGNTEVRFHDLVICLDCRDAPAAVGYAAHEYLHTWEGYPDLYDYDRLDDPQQDVINCPVGAWDIMAGARGAGGLVHSIPPLKEMSGWIEPVDLTTVLTPGVETTITFPPAEFVRNDSYYFLENDDRPGERYYFWSAGSGFDERLPGAGLMILRANLGANSESLPLQQRTPPFTYEIVQADGQGDLGACTTGGNIGDAGDPWPGSSGATRFDFDTVPPANWATLNQWTGLSISDIVPDGSGSVSMTLSWLPFNIPSLGFIDPPGGESVGSRYQVRFGATDVYGGTTIRLYYAEEDSALVLDPEHLIGSRVKGSPGINRMSMDWNLANVPNGRYVVFAKLIPGIGADGTERSYSEPRAGRNNAGNGSMSVQSVDVGFGDTSARLEAWNVVLTDPATKEWSVSSSITQPDPRDNSPNPFDRAKTCPNGTADCSAFEYESVGGEVRFLIREGIEPFAEGDSFSFVTTGITASSSGVTVLDNKISANPRAVIDASPLSGRPPFTVDFDARGSTDPDGLPLTYQWDFGDGGSATGATVSHIYVDSGTFTVVLRATNLFGRFGESAVDITGINNSPNAVIRAEPRSGPAPLTVQFNGSESSDLETNSNQLVYQWDFGDGRSANDQGFFGFQISTEHFYSTRADGTECTSQDPCTFTATLTVTDAGGKQDTESVVIQVGNSNPIPNVIAAPLQGSVPLEVTFSAIGSTDIDGDDLTVDWVWGDGTQDLGVPVTGQSGATDGTVLHTYNTEGNYQPTATIRDGRGGSAVWAGVTIVVRALSTNDSNLRAIFRLTPEGPVLNQSFTANASLSIGDIDTYTWNWGDQSPSSTGLSATHTYTTPGVHQLSLTVSDDDDPPNTARTTRTIIIAGVGADDGDDADNGAPSAIIVVDPTIAEAFVGDSFTFDASGSSDPDGDTLSYSWTFGDGSSATGAVVSHAYSNSGTYLVRLTVRDTHNASTQSTLTVIVLLPGENRTPRAIIATGPRTGSAGSSITFDGRNSFDEDGDELTYTWEFRLAGELVDTLTGATITRIFDTAGTYTVELEVSDGRGGSHRSDPETVLITESVVTPGGSGTVGPVTDPDEGQGIPDSADQRPTQICGLGMVMGLFGSMFGMFLMAMSRRRRHT